MVIVDILRLNNVCDGGTRLVGERSDAPIKSDPLVSRDGVGL